MLRDIQTVIIFVVNLKNQAFYSHFCEFLLTILNDIPFLLMLFTIITIIIESILQIILEENVFIISGTVHVLTIFRQRFQIELFQWKISIPLLTKDSIALFFIDPFCSLYLVCLINLFNLCNNNLFKTFQLFLFHFVHD